MKTKEELNVLKEEVEVLNRELAQLTEEELEQVSGGVPVPGFSPACQSGMAADEHNTGGCFSFIPIP